MFEITKFTSVMFASMIKFIGGPITGLALGLKWVETAIASALGMMIVISVITFGGSLLKQYLNKLGSSTNNTKKFSKSKRFAIRVKSNLGLPGIAFLTPIIFSPIIGGFLANSFKYSKITVFLNMLWSAVLWAIVQTLFMYYLKDILVDIYHRFF